MPIYETVVALGKARGMNVAQIESAAGFKPKYLSKWKTSMPSADKLYAVAKLFGVTMEELMTGNVDGQTMRLSPEEEDLVYWYREADSFDRDSIQTILNRYRKDTHSASAGRHERERA